MSNFLDSLAGGFAYLEARPLLLGAVAIGLWFLLSCALDRAVVMTLNRVRGYWPAPSMTRIGRATRQLVWATTLLLGVMWIIAAVDLSERQAAIALALSQTLVVIAWFIFGTRLVRLILEALGRRPVPPPIAQPTTATLLRNAAKVVLGVAGLYALLIVWGVDITGLVASAGILGLALSLAAQDTLGNLVAGIAILTDKPYHIGDYIVLDTGERGAVTAIGLRSTRLLTRDDVEVSIPNSVMGRAKIVNESGSPQRKYRLRVPVRVGYGADIDRVMQLMLDAAAAHPDVVRKPEPRMRLRSFGDYGLEFEMLCWIDQPANRGIVLHELNCSIYRVFSAEGIAMPIPQQEVHLNYGNDRRVGDG